MAQSEDLNAHTNWEQKIHERSDSGTDGSREQSQHVLPAPSGLRAESGVGQVTLCWEPVDGGAIGYLVYRGSSPDGPFEPVDHGGGDVLAVPGTCYADSTGKPGEPYWYTVAALTDPGSVGELSEPAEACSETEGTAEVTMRVRAAETVGYLDPVWWMIGSERLSQLFSEEETAGHSIGEEFEEALRLAHRDLGVTHVRAHAIFHEDLEVYREIGNEPVYDFDRVDDVYDRLLELGLRPIVELSFMPRDLASDPDSTVFEYKGIISPPRDWQRWADLNARLAAHLVERYGIEEVSQWGFEVWNEANLEVFWTGDQAEYFQLYDVAARAVKSVDERLKVGGPATAAAEWVPDFLDFVVSEGSPCDFLSTHTYGNLPLDVCQALKVRGLDHIQGWWTEWGVTPTHFAPINDSVFGAPFVLHGMKSSQGRAQALAYWVVSDHFEELGRPPSLFHGGFGLLTVGNLRKPRYWALVLANDLGSDLLDVEMEGDGVGSMVDSWATRGSDGSVDILVWNGILDQSRVEGAPALDRSLKLRIEQLENRAYRPYIVRIDRDHSNITRHFDEDNDWPTPEQWAELRAQDYLEEESLSGQTPNNGNLALDLHLPMPGVVRLRLIPT